MSIIPRVDVWSLLLQIVILLGASLLVGGVFSALGQSPLVGYLIAGMLLGGPGSFEVVESDDRAIETIAELGVALLLFSIGLEFSLTRLRQLGQQALVGGTLQVVLTTLLGAGAGLLFGLGVGESIAVGAMLCLSSTAVVLRILTERAEVDASHGRNTVAVLLVQDIAVVPLALLLTFLAGNGTPNELILNASKILGLAALLVAVLYLLLNKLAVFALGSLTLERNRELTVLLSVVTGLGAAFAAHAAGISPALGAFIAGMFLGSSPFATQIRADISSLRVVLLTLFFGSAGMVADPIWIVDNFPLVLGVTLFLTVGKSIVTWTIFQLLGQPGLVAAATGICLAQIGEFAFVLGSIGLTNGLFSETGLTHQLLVSVAIVSLFASPSLVGAAPVLGAKLASWLRLSGTPTTQSDREKRHAPDIVIVGFGPAGQVAAQAVLGRRELVLVLDLNREGVANAQQMGLVGQIGDATQLDVLEHAHVALAKTIVITIPDHRAALTILRHVRNLAPEAHCLVRSRHQRHTNDFVMAGADQVLGDEEQIGSSIGDHLNQWLNEHEVMSTEP